MPDIPRLRNWMKVETKMHPAPPGHKFRSVQAGDAPSLAVLMDRSYRGTIDHEGETREQCLEEMSGTLGGKYGPFLDFASFAMFDAGRALSASLVTLWKERPLLAFSMTDPDAQGKGYGGYLIQRSISALAEHGYRDFFLVVTEGNVPAERLYRKLGFVDLGPALPGQPPPQE